MALPSEVPIPSTPPDTGQPDVLPSQDVPEPVTSPVEFPSSQPDVLPAPQIPEPTGDPDVSPSPAEPGA
ncbi:MAG TPA: hypothetical protein VGO93_15280 [Candidatus Xenobia bacterium]|jgi:hypothetical protein